MSTTKTGAANLVRIEGYHCRRLQTAKAVYVTIHEIDGETVNVDTCWVPRSIATDLRIEAEDNRDGTFSYHVSALVPAWWVRKLDTRTAWEKAGYAYAPGPC